MSIYRDLHPDDIENLFSNFLIDSWSYSRVAQFARNEKAFEMHYIYNVKSKRSATTVAGEAYHHALCEYFTQRKQGVEVDLAELESLAFEYIGDISANQWKIQKTTPTIEDCKKKALGVSVSLLKNFLSESSVYISEIKEILEVETYCSEWLTVNGVDIPLPCHAKIDLVILTHSDKVVIIDHKSKSSFSDEEDLKLSVGVQAITYVCAFEEKSKRKVDEAWFVENKYSTNKDGSPQLNAFKIQFDSDTRRLYEAILYEPLKRMCEAVSNPDYVYLINDSDNFIDKSELYDFWAKTMIAEVGEFNVKAEKVEMISARLKKIRDVSVGSVNPKVIKEFRKNASQFIQYDLSNKDMTQEEKIEHVLRTFGLIVKVAHMFDGFSSNTYLLEVSAGVKIASVLAHRLDIANALDVSNVRIAKDLVVYSSKSYISIETSKKREKDLLFDKNLLVDRNIPVGMDNYGNLVVWNMNNHSTPHVLICGATGSGKSVWIKSTLEYAYLTGMDNIIILDPKYEFTSFKNRKNTDVFNDIEDIEAALDVLVDEMNSLSREGKTKKILVVFDEFADALSQSRTGNELKVFENRTHITVGGSIKTKKEHVSTDKSLEENLKILLQKGRSIGFRIIAATQRASVKVITGDAKVNFPVQICFRVPKEIDSKVVIDEAGAESLSGMGDGLIKSPEYKDTVRFQAFYKP